MRLGFLKPNARLRTRAVIARWVGLLALAALFAMATLPVNPKHRDIAADNAIHWSETWRG